MKVPASKPYFFNNDQKFILNGLKKILAGKSFLSMGNYGKSFENKFGLLKSNSLNLKSGNTLLSKTSIFLSLTPKRVGKTFITSG